MSKCNENIKIKLFYSFLLSSFFGFSQLQLKDSVWLPIYVKDTLTVETQESVASYKSLFYKSIYVPEYDGKESNYSLRSLGLDLSELLLQTSLDNSYTESDIKGTELEKSLRTVETFSYPFASCITSKLAEQLHIKTNQPTIVAYNGKLQLLSVNDPEVLSTKKAIDVLHGDSSVKLDKSLYLRHQLLNFIVGNTNNPYKNYRWKITNKNTIIPYVEGYHNQFMTFDGSYKLITKLVQAYKHLEPYDVRIKNLKKHCQKFIGFDVNVLSELSYASWEKEIDFIQKTLEDVVINTIKQQLPKGALTSKTEQLFDVLKLRIANLDNIGLAYYNLISPHKVVTATNANDLIDIHRTKNGTTINVYNEIDGKSKSVTSYEFLSENTKEIWIYGLKGNDYFEVIGTSKKYTPIKLIGGNNSDKYEISNGKKVTVYDNSSQTFVVHKDKAKFKLAEDNFITKYDLKKYKHNTNRIKPKFGANPDDGLFLGVVNEYKAFGFEQNPFTQLHQVSANFFMGTQGFNFSYYGERTNVFKGFSAFVKLAYQSPNYSTNFFGFGNETPNFDDNLKLDYNRIRMENMDVAVGALKNQDNYSMSVNLFFESRKIEDTPDRFVSSETLFFPEDDFFERKNYTGISGDYTYKELSNSLIEGLKIVPTIEFKVTANTNDFSKTNAALKPVLFIAHPFYDDKITLDATVNYQHVFGDDVPFYQAAQLGGVSGLRGYRNQRFTGQSSLLLSSNLKWFIKNLNSDVLPLQLGILGGFDAGRVWLENETSNTIHTDFGAGLWVQTADLIKAQLQAFKGDEGLRFSFNLSIGF